MMDGLIDIQDTEDGFLLVRTGPDTPRVEMPLTAVDLLLLAQSSQNLRTKAARRLQPEGMGATGVLVSVVSGVALGPDSLNESIHMELHAPNGARTTYSVSPEIAQHIADRLVEFLVGMERHHPTKN